MSTPARLNPLASGRISHMASGIREAVANPDLGGATADAPPPHDRDLVAKLTNDPKNKELWQKLLNNRFCQAMKGAKKDDQNVMKGFKWYMSQDYHYFPAFIQAESKYLSDARTTASFERHTKHIPELVEHLENFFQMCTTPPPGGVGLSPESVLAPVQSKVLPKYINSIVTQAQTEDEVFSKIVTIAGVQSYGILAPDLYRYSLHQDTLWYKFWAEHHYPVLLRAVEQQKLFISNYNVWKDRYEEASELFRKGCEYEIGFWEEASEHSGPNA